MSTRVAVSAAPTKSAGKSCLNAYQVLRRSLRPCLTICTARSKPITQHAMAAIVIQ
ncbi:MAG: hypothetical protein KDC95_05390 [Planctomycetes bacterium]|nr:hypothetical protein [Planctomycetota bacterium]